MLEKTIKPIRPEDVSVKKLESIPQEVIQVFNDLIVKNWNGRYSMFKQKDVITELQKTLNMNKAETFNYVQYFLYLNIEDLYKNNGWDVEYDVPSWSETYGATFKFTPS